MKRFLLILTLLATLPSPAVAAPRLVAPTEAVGNPTFAGDQVVYGAQTSKGTEIRDGSGRALGALPVGPSRPDPFDDGFSDVSYQALELRASAGAVAAFAQGISGSRYGTTIFRHGAVGSRSGQLGAFSPHCLTEQYARVAQRAIDADGSRVAFVEQTCSAPGPVARRVMVRDVSTGSQAAGPVPATDEVRLAGRFVAYRPADQPRAVAVYDLDAQQVVKIVPDSGSRFDVQADGKLAAGPAPGETACTRGVRWYAPGEDAERVIAGCDSALIAIDGEHIGLWRQSPRGLAVARLDGAAREVNVPGTLAFDSADLSGNRIVFSTVGCSRDTGAVWLDDGSDPSVLTPELPECRARAPRGPLKVDRKGRVRVPVTCTSGCRGGLVLSGGRRYRDELNFPELFDVPARKTRNVLVAVGNLSQQFKGRRTINVRVDIRVSTRDGGHTRTVRVVKLKL